MTDESKEITVAEQGGQQVATQADSASVFAMVLEAAKDPEIDADKMTAMADLAIKMQTHEQEQQFNRDKIAALQQMPSISQRGAIKNRSGQVQSRYSKWEDIHRVTKPILNAHNLAISFNIGNTGNMVTVQPILSHTNGFVEKGESMALPIDTTGSKNGTQGAGSAASYGKRHTAKAMLNIVEDGQDDDGQSAGSGPVLTPEQRQLVEDGQRQAMLGEEAYKAWYTALSTAEKGWLSFAGYHDKNKEVAGAQ